MRNEFSRIGVTDSEEQVIFGLEAYHVAEVPELAAVFVSGCQSLSLTFDSVTYRINPSDF